MTRREHLEALYDKLTEARKPSPDLDKALHTLLLPPSPGDALNLTASLDAALEYAQVLGYAPDVVLHEAMEEMMRNGWSGAFPIVPQMAIYVCRHLVGQVIDQEQR